MRRLEVPGGYATEVWVGPSPSPALLPPGPWVLLGDAAVRPAWLAAGMPEPPGTLWVTVPESRKRLETLIPWLEAWAQVPLHRDATVVALGGGVVTDMAGLAASLYMRGLSWQSWPTTLLSQVDAGLGGKTGADLEAGKNLVGAFHAPMRLVACTSFLDTLPSRQMDSGRWELLKTALLLGDLPWAHSLAEDGPVDETALARALAYKAGVTHRDPTEQGERRLLNLGHTLGHALESASGYSLLHGEAVGLGILAACLLADEQGMAPFPAPFLDALAARLAPLAGGIRSWEQLRPWMLRDKKGTLEGIQCILPVPGGPAVQRRLPPEAWISPLGRLMDKLSLVNPRG